MVSCEFADDVDLKELCKIGLDQADNRSKIRHRIEKLVSYFQNNNFFSFVYFKGSTFWSSLFLQIILPWRIITGKEKYTNLSNWNTRNMAQKQQISDTKKLNESNETRKPRHTPASRMEATRRERLRVQGIRLAYRSLQSALNIPVNGRPRYLHILQSAINRIQDLEAKIQDSLVDNNQSNFDHLIDVKTSEEKGNMSVVTGKRKIKSEPPKEIDPGRILNTSPDDGKCIGLLTNSLLPETPKGSTTLLQLNKKIKTEPVSYFDTKASEISGFSVHLPYGKRPCHEQANLNIEDQSILDHNECVQYHVELEETGVQKVYRNL